MWQFSYDRKNDVWFIEEKRDCKHRYCRAGTFKTYGKALNFYLHCPGFTDIPFMSYNNVNIKHRFDSCNLPNGSIAVSYVSICLYTKN